MKEKFLAIAGTVLLAINFIIYPSGVLAAGIGPNGGGSHTVGSTFTVSIVASGTTFNAFQGTIKASGPATISVNPGNASWAPGGTPKNNGQFQGGITSPASSFTIATVTIKGTSVGTGSVSVSGVQLVNNGVIVATGGGSTSFTITRAPTPPGTISVTSSTHPDQAQTYGTNTATFAWTAPSNGVTGYSTVIDQSKDTTPAQTANTTALTASYDNLNLGTYYFHIRGVNGDGWGPTTTYQVNIGRATNSGMEAPKITGVKKLDSFKTDIVAGTVTGFEIDGTSSTDLKDYTVALTFAPGVMPSDQVLTATIGQDGTWKVVFDKAIPAAFYNVTAVATKDQTTTPVSGATTIELSVINGGNAKIITTDDLPKPDLTVKKWGLVFATQSQLNKVGWSALAILLGFAAVCFATYFLSLFIVRKIKAKSKDVKLSKEIKITPEKEENKDTKTKRVM